MLRARDAMNRAYAEPLDVAMLARIAYVSEAHFIRTLRATFGETPNRYLQRRRAERAMFLLRTSDRSVLPPVLDLPTAARLLGIGRTVAYQLVKSNEWPTPLIRVGRLIRVHGTASSPTRHFDR
jgi:AraC-like DNA-binding protein